MGSHDHGRDDNRLPLGLTFDPQFTTPFELGGVPILSDEEDRYLSQFMDAVVSGHEFPANLGEGLNFVEDISQWYGGPEVVAHGTSIGASTSLGLPRPLGDLGTVCPAEVIPPPHSGEIPGLSADVLAAATVLTRPVQAPSLPTPSFDLSAGLQPSAMPIGPPATAAAATAPQYTFTVPLFATDETRARPRNEQDAFIAQMFAGGEPNSALYRQVTEAVYGSDPNFNRPSNQPPAWEPLDSIRSQQDAVMGSFTRIDSAAPTRAPSPVPQNPAPTWPSSPPNNSAPLSATSQCPPTSVENTWPIPPPKRRKTSGDDETVVERETAGLTPTKRYESPSLERPSQPPEEPNGDSRKRRKSKTNWGAPRVKPKPPPRENLTEEQKRENHIRSEQKRRTAIKEDYEELFRLVPTVHVPGPPTSKSHVLNEAANFIRSLQEGNSRLEARLATLKKPAE